MLECAERGLPVVEPVIELLYAVQLDVRLEGLSDFEHTVHPSGVPGDAELVEGLYGIGASGFRVVLGGFDGGQVAEDDSALLVIRGWRVVQRGGKSLNQSGDAYWLPAASVSSACWTSRSASRV
jgi:hypothetical protein